MKNKKLLFSYDEADIAEAEAKHLTENWQDYFDDEPTDEEINARAYNNSDIYQFAWDDFKEALTELMNDKQSHVKNDDLPKYYIDTAQNIGWRNLSGEKLFEANDATELFNAILPDTDTTIRIYEGGKTFFYARISHHDAPTGELHKIKAISARQYNKLNG